MSIPQGHGNVFVSHQLLYGLQINPSLDEARCKCMTGRMKRHVLQLRMSDCSLKGSRNIAVGLAFTVQKHWRLRIGVYPNRLQRFCQYRCHRNATGLSIFGIGGFHSDKTMLKIYVLPRE